MKNQNKSNNLYKFIKFLNVVFYVFLITTFPIVFIIYFRPFYYWQIKSLDIEQTSHYSYSTIKTAYDSIMNYLSWFSSYSVGSLKSSVDGQAHFHDVKILFTICTSLFLISLLVVISISIFKFKHKNNFKTKFNQSFYASVFIVIFAIIISIFALINFDKDFEIFHKIFFFEKYNWILNPDTDQIINILPEEFFRNCTIFILSTTIIICCSTIVYNLIKLKKITKN
ncbi:TIGR01906 family membrane protein [Mycoplasma cottewii]|uniref:TIGR01906 family membrane protein n=1 Tax=Mycoplasma cottewii TaxID=51364 RepID=A0ABY5TXH6_9MOLU|nr:TIGR01906 family membrane protein [Mycoplasma cottewii]UWD35383.1 TIGR01906 family membrane protein [Mycoplasma cottewii]